MTNLSSTQQQILKAAARRKGGALLPLPEGLALKGGTLTRTLTALEKRGLAVENDKGLVLTKAGRAAARREVTKDHRDAEPTSPGTPAPPAVRPDSKQGRLMLLLQRSQGATIADMRAVTGWQAHSVRAALTGLRKRGLAVTRDQEATRGAVYHAQAE
jgi:DNA-binding MarR family transcriptional regulator